MGAKLSTVTVTVPEVVLLPAASLATAVKLWLPLVAVVVSQVKLCGEVVSSAERLAPSSLNWTPATPTLSEAVAETVTVLPLSEAPEVGAERETVGAIVSGDGPLLTVATAEATAVEPSAAMAFTIKVWLALLKVVVLSVLLSPL